MTEQNKQKETEQNNEPSPEERLNELERKVDELMFREGLMAKHSHNAKGEVSVPY